VTTIADMNEAERIGALLAEVSRLEGEISCLQRERAEAQECARALRRLTNENEALRARVDELEGEIYRARMGG
jgi:hypothetical protein